MRNIFVLLTMLLTTGIASATTITVDDSGGADYTKIQDAINAANAGDTIEVRSGTYYENVDVNKQLILKGIDTGGGKPVVDASGSGSAIILSVDGIRLENFYTTNSYFYQNAGIKVVSNNNILNNNTAALNVERGILLYYSENNVLTNNIVSNNEWGINVYFSRNNKVSENNGENNRIGIRLDFSDSNTIENNIINSNTFSGIYLQISNYNTINDNIANLNGYSGIGVVDSRNNLLIRNTANSNQDRGIYLSGSTLNIVYQNEFNNNIVTDGNINQWDNGIDIGNHYNNFDEPSEGCNDTDNNGICDSSYNIPGGSSIDRYPIAIGSSGCGNTPSGQNVDVNPSQNIDMTYDNVVQCGNTSVTTYSGNQWSPLPNNYEGISFNDIQTTATYSDSITVNITYSDSDISGIDENSIKMFHYENGNWVDVTTSLDVVNNKVTGIVNSLSPFAVAGSSSGTPTPTISPTPPPISGGGTVRGSSLNTANIVILTVFLMIVSILKIRKN